MKSLQDHNQHDSFVPDGIGHESELRGRHLIDQNCRVIPMRTFAVHQAFFSSLSIQGNSPRQKIWQALDQCLATIDWSETFERPFVLLYFECLWAEMIVDIHYWLRTKNADIKNITLICPLTLGTASWWKNWCAVMNEKSFRLQDTLVHPPYKNQYCADLPIPDHDMIKQQKIGDINKWFSYFGGSQSRPERDYAFLMLYQLRSHAHVEYLASKIDIDLLIKYVEYNSYYCDQPTLDLLHAQYRSWYNTCNLAPTGMIANEKFGFEGYQWHVDRQCAASVIRETHMDQPFAAVTEKTLRCFYHFNLAIPLGYRAVEQLEQQGFWFPTDMIDFDYQHEINYHERVKALVHSLRDWVARCNLAVIKSYIENNWYSIRHNHDLVVAMMQYEPVE